MFKRKPKSDKPKAAKPAKDKKDKKAPAKREKAVRPAMSRLPAKKKPTDIYTVMLIISSVAVLIAVILLYLELSSYGKFPWWNAA